MFFYGKKNAGQKCPAENKIKKLCVEQKKGDNKTDDKSNKIIVQCPLSSSNIIHDYRMIVKFSSQSFSKV